VDKDDRKLYRDVIDRLVQACQHGQGQIGANRARAGVWNAAANHQPDRMPDQRSMNLLLLRLEAADRQVLAQMLTQAFESGVHETLVTLHEAEIAPFDAAYEGTPFHDFAGRVAGWTWPTDETSR
jgi:hypothetical protein